MYPKSMNPEKGDKVQIIDKETQIKTCIKVANKRT